MQAIVAARTEAEAQAKPLDLETNIAFNTNEGYAQYHVTNIVHPDTTHILQQNPTSIT
jgi:hypothetical protein